MEIYADELTTNIIRDASKTANENFNNTNELNFLQTSKQTESENTTTPLDKSEHSTADDNNFDCEDIQDKMNRLIHDIRSQSGDDTNIPRKSITSNTLHHDPINNSTPMDPISNNLTEGPRRSLSESALADHPTSNEQRLPIRQDETSSDSEDLYGVQSVPINISSPIDDSIDQHQSVEENQINNPLDDNEDFFNTKTRTMDDNPQSSSVVKLNGLDETTRFGTTSSSRVLSAASKQSIHVASDELPASGDEKHALISPSELPGDTGNDTDRNNQEVASAAMLPLNRSRSSTPNDSRKSSTHLIKVEDTNHLQINNKDPTSLTLNNTNTNSSVLSDDNQQDEEQQKQSFQSFNETILSASRRESTNNYDQQQTSRTSSNHTNHFVVTEESSKLIKPGKQLHIPTKGFVNERINSPPPSPAAGIKSMVLLNPLLGSNLIGKEQDRSRSPSEISRKSPTINLISNEEIIHEDILSSNNRRDSNISQQTLNITDQKSISRHGSQDLEEPLQIPASRRGSSAQQQDELDSHRDQQTASGRISKASQESTNHRESSASEQQISSRRESAILEQKPFSRKGSAFSEQQLLSKRESHSAEQQSSDRRQSLSNQQEQKSSSKPVSRKTSVAEQQRISSRRESLQQALSSRCNSPLIQEQQSIPVLVKNDSRRSSLNIIDKNDEQLNHKSDSTNKEIPSLDTDAPIRTSAKHKQEHTSSIDKQQKSSSTLDKNNKHRSSFPRRSEQQSKRNSNLITDETVVTPIIIDSSKTRQNNGKRSSTTDSDFEHKPPLKLPSVNSSFQQEKPRRSEIKQVSSSSHPTTPSEDEQATHWTKNSIIPPVHFTDDEQKAEHNQTTKKQSNAEDEQKRKEQHHLIRRSLSANSSTPIRLVDDKSLDSTSENNTDFSRHNRRNIKSKKKDVQTNTDQTFTSQQHAGSDEQELTPQKPLKATKPMSDHLHSTRQRTLNKEKSSKASDKNTPTVRCTVTQSNDSNQDKDSVNVNVTVVVKKIAADETSHTTAETFIDQKPQQYFQPVQDSSANKEKLIERSKSTEHHDRPTQSDTEQITTEKQKTRRRPKRISRTSQTYECVFRRMEREQHQALRATDDTEKISQTRKSQLHPRKKSPKKYFPPFISADSFRIEEILRKQYHQSRRNLSKSSSLPRSLSPQRGKLLILRPTLPFHHTDAVNVQRVCLQYAIDLIPHGTSPTHRNQLNPSKQPEQTNTLPTTSKLLVNAPKNKSHTKEKSTSNQIGEHTHQRKTDGTI